MPEIYSSNGAMFKSLTLRNPEIVVNSGEGKSLGIMRYSFYIQCSHFLLPLFQVQVNENRT